MSSPMDKFDETLASETNSIFGFSEERGSSSVKGRAQFSELATRGLYAGFQMRR